MTDELDDPIIHLLGRMEEKIDRVIALMEDDGTAPEPHRAGRLGGQAASGFAYDPEADAMHIGFVAEGAAYDGTTEVAPGVFVDFDQDGRPMGVEVISVRRRLEGKS